MPANSSPNATRQSSTPNKSPEIANHCDSLQPSVDAIDYLKAYARERPEVAALWCVGIGFILGWKLKPW